MALKDKLLNDNAKEKRELKKRISQLEKIIAAQNEQLKAKTPKIKLGRSSRRKLKSFQRVIIPDTHGCFIDEAAAAAFLKDLEQLDPREVIFLGDHLDCAGWLAQHHPFTTVQEARYSFAEDVAATNSFLDEVQKRAPKAEFHYLEGNHEARLEKFCVESTTKNPRDAEWLRQLVSPRAVLHLDARKIRYYRKTERIGGLRQPGILKLGHCCFTHGTRAPKHAAKAMLDLYKHCVVFGHVHRRMQAGTSDLYSELDAWCPGCLCILEPTWKNADPTEWSHGYGLQVVLADGRFLHLNIPILNGQSFLPALFQ